MLLVKHGVARHVIVEPLRDDRYSWGLKRLSLRAYVSARDYFRGSLVQEAFLVRILRVVTAVSMMATKRCESIILQTLCCLDQLVNAYSDLNGALIASVGHIL